MRSGYISCPQALKQIRAALKRRSDKRWSVTTQRGTAYGWIRVVSPPSSGGPNDMTDEDRRELAELFSLPLNRVGLQGITISPEDDFYQEYIDRAEGNEPIVRGVIDHYRS